MSEIFNTEPRTGKQGSQARLIDGTGQQIFLKLFEGLVKDPDISLHDAIVYTVLYDLLQGLQAGAIRRGEDPKLVQLFPSHRWISQRLHGKLSVRSVCNSIRNLRVSGWIETMETSGLQNEYALKAKEP